MRITPSRLALAAALLATAIGSLPSASTATTVKALSFAINESNGSGDRTPIKNYMAESDVDFGVFDYAKSPNYFINADYSQDGKNYKVNYYSTATANYKLFVWNSDKYTLVSNPADDKSSDKMAAVFEDTYGDQYALISIRTSYSASSVNTYVGGIATKYPGAKLIVTYNARVGTSNATTLNASLTTDSAGPQMTCLGRTDVDGTAIGGVYMYPNDVPSAYSVSLVPKSIGTKYDGTLATLEFGSKYQVIFQDWDGTGLQTNIVAAGGSVTPPTPSRPGYTFIGWDYPASAFASVTESFTATAQYDVPMLFVLGDPEAFGTADPAYGTLSAIAANDSFTASVTAPAPAADATERWVCTGYTHYEITDQAAGTKTVNQQGNTSSFTYTHVWRDEIVWHFTNEWLVTVSSTPGGSISSGSTWVRNAETLALVATPEEGWAFSGWLGDTDGIENTSTTSITPTITAARSLQAVFVPSGAAADVQYVATTGDDANSGYFAESPKLTIQAAIDTLATAPGYGTVHVAAGTYPIDTGIVVSNAIAVIGDTGNPEDVIVHNTKVNNQAQVIVFSVNHPDAFVANLTAENGHRNAPSSPYGCNVSIGAAGGTVSNCVLRNATSLGNYARGTGAWLNSDNALLTHCVITNNRAPGNGYQMTETGGKAVYGGMFVHIEKGTVDNCLIANNLDTGGSGLGGQDKQSWSSGVTVRNGGRLLNSSVVTNEARWTGGVYLYPNGVATNVVVAGCVNKCTYTNSLGQIGWTDIGFKGTLANASHCASDGSEELDETCVAGTAQQFFRDYAAHDYTPAAPKPNTPTLVNKGIAYAGIATIDLLGKAREPGSLPDIGCYEYPTGRTIILLR